MKVYVTKYALTDGILEKEVERTDISPLMVVSKANIFETYHKPHWHEDIESAVAKAEDMRTKKIKSIQKQLKRIEALKFL